MDSLEGQLDQALAGYLARREEQPELLPGDFAEALPTVLRSRFLAELEELAEIDRLTSAPPRHVPHRFGDFRLLGQIGEGGHGTVYEAEQVSLRRRVALKIMHPHLARDGKSVARFQREGRTAAALQHPGIVPVHGLGVEDGWNYLVMGLVEGHSLHRLLQARCDPRDVDHSEAQALLAKPERLAMAFAQAADALHYAHIRGVTHRDIKPANLMVNDEGQLFILDFGLATSRMAEEMLTVTGDLMGTPLYMSPEQASGDSAQPASDIYSLGAVLFECLTGRTIVADGSLPAVLDRVRNMRPSLRRVTPDLPGELVGILRCCLQRDPRKRYRSAAVLADALRRFGQGQVEFTSHRSWWLRVRRPLTGIVALTASVALGLSLAASTPEPARAQTPSGGPIVVEKSSSLNPGDPRSQIRLAERFLSAGEPELALSVLRGGEFRISEEALLRILDRDLLGSVGIAGLAGRRH